MPNNSLSLVSDDSINLISKRYKWERIINQGHPLKNKVLYSSHYNVIKSILMAK